MARVESTDFIHWSEPELVLAGDYEDPESLQINSMPVEVDPSGVLLLLTNKDRPGIVGYIGTLLGRHKVNIASMSLSRDNAGGQALTVLNLDSVPPEEMMQEIQKDADISNVRVVKL